MGQVRRSGSSDEPTTGPTEDPAAAVRDFAGFWAALEMQARAQGLSISDWAARASRLAGRNDQTGRSEHKSFSTKTLYDRAQKGRRVEWDEAQWFVAAIPEREIWRWRAAWERAEQQWLALRDPPTVDGPDVAVAIPLVAQPAVPDAQEPDTASTAPSTSTRRRNVLLVGAALVVAAGAALLLLLTAPLRDTSAVSAAPSPIASTGQVGMRRLVCANSLSVMREPKRKDQTEMLAQLQRGDAFLVERMRGQTWAYGTAEGSSNVRGWVLTEWLKPTC